MRSDAPAGVLDEVRNDERLDEFKIAFKISAIQLIGPLFPLFAIADYLAFSSNFIIFLCLRISVLIYCFALYYFTKNYSNLTSLKISSILLLAYPSFVITFMIAITGDISHVYFVGLNLISSGAICFFPWKNFKEISLVAGIVYGPYVVLPFLFHDKMSVTVLYGLNWFFISGSIIISVVIRIIYEKLKYKEIIVRQQLKEEIENRNAVIKDQSAAAVRLSSLSKQFSPQIIRAIEVGDLDITRSLKRVQICAIFIDIVNSTERVNRIDKDDLNKALSMFMDDTMSILLKYDITIDKFLGDGVLAFSNAPIQQNDYVRRVVESAIEIKSRILERRTEYIEFWKNELEIRIGIDTGYANVGFYGSKDNFRSYTAIGSVVNLASRLCAIAEPCTILVSKDVHKCISDISDYKLSDLGLRKIKGFESDIIKVYELQSNKDVINSSIPYCPVGHGILNLDVNDKGIYEFKCKQCSYKLDSFMSEKKKSA